jgi:hypothetical protein
MSKRFKLRLKGDTCPAPPGGGGGRTPHRGLLPGRAVQVDPMTIKLKPPGTKRLQLNCDEPLPTSAVKFKLRRYIQAELSELRKKAV